jgi:prepilin-type N-terminal cleavage/methylation domain-containing protein
MKRAFTLIELLVVIAIIAILAAILFPVFAQAKAAAKTTNSISNMKQIGTGLQLYMGDSDDVYPIRRVAGFGPTGLAGELSWKQVTYPYIKSTQLFTDTVNPKAKYPDDCSDPALRASWGSNVIGPVMARGYALSDIPWLHAKNWSASTTSATTLESPAGTLAIAEHKRAWVDTGPYLDWNRDDWDPITGTIGDYPWGGKKWDDKAMVLIFHDSHAKRASNSAICGKADEMNMWGYQRNQLSNYGGLGDVTWVDTFCATMPAAVR